LGRSNPLVELLAWLRAAPPGTMIPATSLLAELVETTSATPTLPAVPVRTCWRSSLWVVPPETRLGVREVAEAIGRPASWVYRRTAEKSAKAPLPHRKLDGELVFTAGELRAWIEGHESVIVPALRRTA
jgi:predicted DNA-binding transcriptional regulator AlpA